jgi:hypothetical protein
MQLLINIHKGFFFVKSNDVFIIAQLTIQYFCCQNSKKYIYKNMLTGLQIVMIWIIFCLKAIFLIAEFLILHMWCQTREDHERSNHVEG